MAVVLQHSLRRDSLFQAEAPLLINMLYSVTDYGYLGVALFFVISGFCIHLRTAKGIKRDGRVTMNWKDFWWRRIHRLYPPYLGMLLISMSLWTYVWYQGGADIYPSRSGWWPVVDFISHLFMLHGLHPALDQGAGNPAYWTLAREEYLYLMYAAVLVGARRLWGAGKMVWLVLLAGIITYLISDALVPASSPWHRLVVLSPVYLWIQWALGALAVEAYVGNVRLPRWCYWLSLVPVWFALGLFCMNHLPVLEPAAWAMTFFTLVNYCVRRETEIGWPKNFLFRWLFAAGVFSYSMYLAHPVVVASMHRVLHPAQLEDPFANLLFDLAAALCCVIAGKVYYEIVEKHFLNTSPKEPAPIVEAFNSIPKTPQLIQAVSEE